MAGDALWPYVAVSWDPLGTAAAVLTTATDNRGNVVSVQGGSPTYSNSWAATGGISMLFNGTSWAQMPNIPALNFGAADFEINLWMYQTVRTSPWASVLEFGADAPASGWRLLIGPTGQVHFNTHQGAGTTSTGTPIPLNTGTHLAVGRNGGSDFMYVNGVSQAITGAFGNPSSYPGVLGMSGTLQSNTWPYTGFIDRLEILSGAARHTAAFTPETSPFLPYAGQVSGVIRDSTDALCARTVRIYRRDTGALVGTMTSNPTTGIYSFDCPTLVEHNVIALDDAAGTFENDRIIRVVPT